MIVIGESNLVLELALHQEDSEDVERLVALAEARHIQLVIPACALFEPHETLIRRRNERRLLLDSLHRHISQVARSRDFRDLHRTSRGVTESLARSAEIEARGLSDTVARLLRAAQIIPLTVETLARAQEAERQFSFAPQDAIVFASVEQHLAAASQDPRLFINKNHVDFLRPEIEMHLGDHYACKLIPYFPAARQYIDSRLLRPN